MQAVLSDGDVIPPESALYCPKELRQKLEAVVDEEPRQNTVTCATVLKTDASYSGSAVFWSLSAQLVSYSGSSSPLGTDCLVWALVGVPKDPYRRISIGFWGNAALTSVGICQACGSMLKSAMQA